MVSDATPSTLQARLRAVVEGLADPELGLTFGELGMVKKVDVSKR